MSILLLAKRSDEVRRYVHDWSDFLGADTISTQMTTASGVTVDSSDIETGDQSIEFVISGGTDGTVATITQSIVTAAGDEETEIFVLLVGNGEPVSLTEAKAQCRMLEDDSEDVFIASLIAPARAFVERVGRVSLVGKTVSEAFYRWGDYLEIYRRPVASIDSITYGSDGTGTDYEDYQANLSAFPVRIYPIDDFPELDDGVTGIVTYTTGALGETSEEYLIAKRAVLLLVGHWFEFREAAATGQVSDEIEFCITSMMDSIRPVSGY